MRSVQNQIRYLSESEGTLAPICSLPKLPGSVNRFIVLTARNIFESFLYYFARVRSINTDVRRVVFVCSGNICRSAFADYLLKSEMNSDVLSIDSCGLNVGISSPPPPEALKTAREFSVDLESHISKGWENCDLENADMILAMEFWQYRKLVELFPHKKGRIRLLREFTPFPVNLLCNIDDPFGQSEDVFGRCFHQIKRAVDKIKTMLTH